MEKLDRLVWADGISFYAYGLRIGIRTDRAEVMEKIVGCLPPGWEQSCSPFVDHLYSLKVGGTGPRPNVRQYTLLYAGLTRLARTMDLNEALTTLTGDLETYVARKAMNRVFLHAGVVGWKGRAILLPGRSFAGKSTLVAALLRAGATYYSDEFAVLDGKGLVHPFPRPLSMRKETGESLGQQGPERFGGIAGSKPLPIGVVAFLEYRKAGGEQWRPLSAGQAVLELVKYTYCADAEPEMAVFTIQTAVRNCQVWKGKRGEADASVAHLLHLAEKVEIATIPCRQVA